MTRRTDDSAIDTRQRLPLQAKVLVDRVSLTQDAIDHVVTIIDPTPLIQHVIRLGGLGIVGTVCVDVGSYVRQQVGTVASLGDERADPSQFSAVVEKDLAMS